MSSGLENVSERPGLSSTTLTSRPRGRGRGRRPKPDPPPDLRRVKTEGTVLLTCHVCGGAFETKDELTTHLWSSHRQKFFACHRCDQSFGSYHLFSVHLSTAHGDVEGSGHVIGPELRDTSRVESLVDSEATITEHSPKKFLGDYLPQPEGRPLFRPGRPRLAAGSSASSSAIGQSSSTDLLPPGPAPKRGRPCNWHPDESTKAAVLPKLLPKSNFVLLKVINIPAPFQPVQPIPGAKVMPIPCLSKAGVNLAVTPPEELFNKVLGPLDSAQMDDLAVRKKYLFSRVKRVASASCSANSKCPSCGERYHQIVGSLLKHMWEKHKIKGFVCEICKKSYGNKHLLCQHISGVHCPDKKLSCDLCGKGFVKNCQLEVHLKSAHKTKGRTAKKGGAKKT